MKTIKAAKNINTFNILFSIVSSIILLATVITQSLFLNVNNFLATNKILIQRILERLKYDSILEKVTNFIDNISTIYIIYAFIIIFILLIIFLVLFGLINHFYKKALKNKENRYFPPVVSLILNVIVVAFIISLFSMNIFNFIIFNNPMFAVIKFILLVTTIIAIGLNIKYIYDIFKVKGIKLEEIKVSKILNIILILIFTLIGFKLMINMLLLTIINILINSISFVDLLQLNSLIDILTNNIFTSINFEPTTIVSTGIEVSKATFLTDIDNFIATSITEMISSYFVSRLIPAIIFLLVSIYLYISSKILKDSTKIDVTNVIFVVVLFFSAIALMVFNILVLGTLLGLILLAISVFKMVLIYLKNKDLIKKAIIKNK